MGFFGADGLPVQQDLSMLWTSNMTNRRKLNVWRYYKTTIQGKPSILLDDGWYQAPTVVYVDPAFSYVDGIHPDDRPMVASPLEPTHFLIV